MTQAKKASTQTITCERPTIPMLYMNTSQFGTQHSVNRLARIHLPSNCFPSASASIDCGNCSNDMNEIQQIEFISHCLQSIF